MHEATLTNIVHRTENIYSFFFRTSKPMDYIAGQFIELYLPQLAKQKNNKRWFTLCSSPSEQEIMITTRIPKKPSSFKRALRNMKTGENVKISDPMGDFVMPLDTAIPLVFVALGIGVTPYRSMLKWVADNNESRDINLIYAVSNKSELLFANDIKNANCERETFVNKPLTAELIATKFKQRENTRLYLSGPEPIVEELYHSLIDLSINKADVITDYFPGYTKLAN